MRDLSNGTENPQRPASLCVQVRRKNKKKQTVSSTKWHKRKENPSPARLDVAAPQNRHLKMRLIQPLPLRAARRKNSRKTIMHRCNQGRFKEKKKKTKLNNNKKKLFILHIFCLLVLEKQPETSLICFPADISVELTSNLTFIIFILREICPSSPAMYISASLSLGIFFSLPNI